MLVVWQLARSYIIGCYCVKNIIWSAAGTHTSNQLMYLVCGTLYDMFAVSEWALGIIYTYYITGFMCFVSAFPTATADQFQTDPCISLKINGLLWSMFQSRAQCHLLEGEIILVMVPACEW